VRLPTWRGTKRGEAINRVAVLFEYPTLNGGERSMLAVFDWLVDGGFEFVALAPARGRLADALSRRRIRHVPLQLHDEKGTHLPREVCCRNLLAAVQTAAPNLLHANSLSMGRLTGAIAGQLSWPTIVHIRDILNLSRSAVADLNCNRLLIAVSQATRNFHVQQGLESDRVRVLYNGIDCRQFQPRESAVRLKQELGLPEHTFLVVTIGQIGLRKGQDVLAEAAGISAERLRYVHYLLIGERNSAKMESIEFEQNVIHRFQQTGLGDRVHWLGYRDDVARIMNEADLLVHPAHQEPLGRVLLEAAASGLPIIATAVGGTPEILTDGKSARLIPPGDPHLLAVAMIELVADDQSRRQFAAVARRRVERQFDIRDTARRLAAVWQESIRAGF